MSNETIKAAFSIEGYKINSFSFKEPKSESDKLAIKFDPKGFYDENTGAFKLVLGFQASEESQDVVIEVILTSTFKFNSSLKLSEIPSYFYKNSIAIVFPYLRSFVSTLTLQANLNIVVLPLLNLSSLEKPLKENTVVEGN